MRGVPAGATPRADGVTDTPAPMPLLELVVVLL
jgi:hypothetical protein